jgi:galactokinase
MPSIHALNRSLDQPESDYKLSLLYGSQPDHLFHMRRRWKKIIEEYQTRFPAGSDVRLYSTPGRTEVGGNHTDHNAGRVLAASVDLDQIAVAGRTDNGIVTVYSEGYPKVVVDTSQLDSQEEERFSTAALIRGICARMKELGYQVGGFNACISSEVPKGSGLSSSAAFEVQIGTIMSDLFNDGKLDPVQNAIISQYAENVYFGKPCGLMDQTTCSVGGFVTIDFRDAAKPIVHKVPFDFSSSGFALVIVETGGDHAGLTDEYANVTGEMKMVARALGGKVLRDSSKQELLNALPALKQEVNDRAILRALHFFDDDQRVVDEVAALETGQFQRFLELVTESGRSSWMLLQNCYSTRNPQQQGITLALAITSNFLNGKGACRIHGGGFAGTIQAFVPSEMVEGYVHLMEAIFGNGACYPVMIRSIGSTRFDLL